MRKYHSFWLMLLLGFTACNTDPDPGLAFNSLYIEDETISVPTFYFQQGEYVLSACDTAYRMREFTDPGSPGACSGTAVPGWPDNRYLYSTSSGGDTVLQSWQKDGNTVFQLIDISNPMDAVPLGSIDNLLPGLGLQAFGVHRGFLYANVDFDELQVFDIRNISSLGDVSDPSTIRIATVQVGTLSGSMNGIFLGDYLYLGGNGENLYVFNVADPTDPRLESVVHLQYVSQMQIEGERLYCQVNQRFQTYDISDPAKPIPIGDFEIGREDWKVINGYLYVVEQRAFKIYDLDDPRQGLLVRYLDTPYLADHQLYFVGDRILAVNHSLSEQMGGVLFNGNTP